jgi:TM2 domain-containing membrane protein YozV
VAALLSLVPGAGHMYLGQIGKGFALMSLLFLGVFLVILYSDATGIYWMTAYLIPTLCTLFLSYAIFDSIAVAGAMREGKKPADDPTMQAIWDRALVNRRTIGWVFVVAGAIGVLQLLAAPINRLLRDRLGIDVPLAALILPIVLFAVGLSLVRRGGRAR